MVIGSGFKMVRASSMRFATTLTVAAVMLMGLLATSCQTTETIPPGVIARAVPEVQILNPGDVIRIAFPGAPNLETTQQIRRDGRINLYLIGEVKAAERSPSELERELLAAYSNQLQSKEIKVTVISSAFAVYVMGAVVRPGKISPERSLSAFDAVMEAGGFDTTRADTKNVRVIRLEDGKIKTYPLNMKGVLEGAQTEPFYLKSYDTVYVPEKFSWL